MDGAPYAVNESSSVMRCYRLFRTMGLRHLVVVDGDHRVTGIITRRDMTHHRLHSHWMMNQTGASGGAENMAKFVNIDAVLAPAQVVQGGAAASRGGRYAESASAAAAAAAHHMESGHVPYGGTAGRFAGERDVGDGSVEDSDNESRSTGLFKAPRKPQKEPKSLKSSL